MSSLGLIPPKSEPVTDRPRMMSNDGTLIGAKLPSTPRTTVFPQPCTQQDSTVGSVFFFLTLVKEIFLPSIF